MVQKLWIYLLRLLRYVFFNSKLWLPVWTGSKGQIGSLFCKYFLTINDLYNGAKIVNLPLAVVEIWFFKDIQLWLPVWTGSKGQIRVTFLSIFFDKQRSVQWFKNFEFTSCGCWDMIFLNIKLWFIVIRYLMTSSWRHKFCIIYLLCSKYMPSFKFVWRLQVCVFL